MSEPGCAALQTAGHIAQHIALMGESEIDPFFVQIGTHAAPISGQGVFLPVWQSFFRRQRRIGQQA